jgi:lipopolysaccharide/colanic/teichoic acid biosynthesis glycosyltransferase
MRNQIELKTHRVVLAELMGPFALYLTVAVAAGAAVLGAPLVPTLIFLVLAWIVGVDQVRRDRLRRLRAVVTHFPLPRVSRESLSGDQLATVNDQGGHGVDPAIAARFAERRFVVLCGPRDSPTIDKARDAVSALFSDHRLVLPARGELNGRAPLTTLLTSDLLPLGGKFVLWLDDLGVLMDRGFDPRVIERWLAGGRSRLVVGWMSAADRKRYAETGTSEGMALERSADFMDVHARQHGPSATVLRYNREARGDAAAAIAIHMVAIHQALGANKPAVEPVTRAVRMVTGEEAEADLIPRLCAGEHATLQQEDDFLSLPRDVSDLIDEQVLEGSLTERFVEAMLQTSEPADLIAIGLGLARRGEVEIAEAALESAGERGSLALRKEVTRARLHVLEIRDGASGATLTNAGGFDYEEPVGQRLRHSGTIPKLPDQPDDDFDPRLPDEHAGRLERLYRQTVRRAVARVATLVAIDCLAVGVGSAVAIHFRMVALKQHDKLLGSDFVSLVLPTLAVAVGVGVFLGVYRPHVPRFRLSRVTAQMAFATMVVMAGFVIVRVNAGTVGAIFALFASATVIASVLRLTYDVVSRHWVRRRHLSPRVLVLGREDDARRLAHNIRRGERPVQPVAYMSPVRAEDPFCVGDYGRLQSRDELERLRNEAYRLHVAEIAIADRQLPLETKARVIAEAQRMGLDVRFMATDSEVILGAVGAVQQDGLVFVPAALMAPETLELKRHLDRVIIYVTLPAWGLILLGYACHSWMRRRGQPIFVYADRVSIGQTGFSMFQLRTRHVHDDETRGVYATGRVEAFFERTGLDEIAQVFNVLRNEMAIVGPRPLTLAETGEQLSQDQRRTLGARPGMTGPWQVAWARGATEEDMRALDADYLRRWRFSHDIELILTSPAIVFRRWKAAAKGGGRRRR